jgi:predicted anti-sigma-YlaC factor YlaD
MSDHILELLGAYLDGELHGRQLHNVEEHLTACESCRAELASLQALSGILQEAPAAEFPSADRFPSHVTLRLARRPVTPIQRKALEIGWWMIPVGLLMAWIFINTTSLVSNMVSAANEVGLLNGASAGLFTDAADETYWSGTLGQFGLLSGDSLQWAERTESFSRTAIPEIAWQVAIALLYLCWIAIWWARRTHQELGQLLESGSRPTVE